MGESCAVRVPAGMAGRHSTGPDPLANVEMNTVYKMSGANADDRLVDRFQRGETWPNPIS